MTVQADRCGIRFMAVGCAIWLASATVANHDRQLLSPNASVSGASSLGATFSSSRESHSKQPCLALANDDFQVQRQILLTFQGRPGVISNSDIRSLQTSFIKAYNSIASCSNGAGVHITKLKISRNAVNSFGATITPMASDNVTQQFTFLATAKGFVLGSSAVPFRLFKSTITGTARQRHRGLMQQNSSRIETHGGAAGRQKSKESTPTKVICQCPVPSKKVFFRAWNSIGPKPTSIDLMVNFQELDSYSQCSTVETPFETTVTIQFAHVALSSNDMEPLSSQYALLEKAVLQTYNNINALNAGNVCDPLFITVTDVKLASGPGNGLGSTGLNRRGLAGSPTSGSSSSGVFIFNVTGVCRGAACSANVPPLFDDNGTSQRQRNLESSFPFPSKETEAFHNEMMEVAPVPPFQARRRLPVIDGACYCPVGATSFRRPTKTEFYQALNARLALLGPKGAGLITTVSNAQDSFQVVPVNCSSAVNFLTSLVTVDFVVNEGNATFNPDELATLGQSIQESYNGVAQLLCDPLFRTVESVALNGVVSNNRLLAQSDTHRGLKISRNRTVTVTLSFSVRGRCRGCASSTPLFNDASGRFLETLVDDPLSYRKSTGSSAPDYGSTYLEHRLLQQDSNQTSQCFCSLNVLGNRAPNVAEFTTAYNQTVTTALNASVSVGTVDASKPLPPSRSPSSSPSSPAPETSAPTKPTPPTAEPSRMPTIIARTFPPTGAPSQRPIAVVTGIPSNRPINLTPPPIALPTLSPFRPPTAADPSPVPMPRPSGRPTNAPSAMLIPPPSATPSQKPTSPPTAEPTYPLTAEPTALPVNQPTPPPTPQPSPRPVPSPVPPPTTLQLPTPRPTGPPKPTEPPKQRPTSFPSPRPVTPIAMPDAGFPVAPIFPVFFPSIPTFLNPNSRPH